MWNLRSIVSCSVYHLCLLELPSEAGILGNNIIIIDQDIHRLSIVIGARVLWNVEVAWNEMMDRRYT